MAKAKKNEQVDKQYMVKSDINSEYSGLFGYCVEVIVSKRYGTMLKLELDHYMWFNENELTELKEF